MDNVLREIVNSWCCWLNQVYQSLDLVLSLPLADPALHCYYSSFPQSPLLMGVIKILTDTRLSIALALNFFLTVAPV